MKIIKIRRTGEGKLYAYDEHTGIAYGNTVEETIREFMKIYMNPDIVKFEIE